MQPSHNPNSGLPQSGIGQVTGATRRFVQLRLPSGTTFSAKSSTKALDATVGDFAEYSLKGQEYFIERLHARFNSLKRTYFGQQKVLAANADLLLAVTAVGLLNTAFLDRILVAAAVEHIPACIVLNKIDQDTGGTAIQMLAAYSKPDIRILPISALTAEGIETIHELLKTPKYSTIVLAGLSGVGKSTLLNRLIPGSDAKTGDLSIKSRQGRQTTTHASAYNYARQPEPPALVIDLPGLSNFGLSHLTAQQVRDAFPEFLLYQVQCQFSNCFHLNEPECAVKRSVQEGRIAPSRYASYTEIIEEINAAKPY
ncbi:MAG: ribosome small subunit-dependent GTPase A [Deltaproteobacteria bacterium]|nr:ribosome small subunit-dependent GTPase A [Deltaproteobacteria bacterium]